MRLAGKVAIVTGAGSGIGRGTAELFAREGASVVVAEIDPVSGQKVAKEIVDNGGDALSIEVDVTDSSAVEGMVSQALEHFGQVDILVNNAGRSFGHGVLEIDDENWQASLDLILTAPFYCSRAILPHMIERGGGSIVNIASVRALAGTGEEGYSAAKAGLTNLTLNMAVRYGRYGVRVNAICPGTVLTGITAGFHENPEVSERVVSWYPLGRIGQPEDVAYACLYLASDEASWVSGAILPVDGGLMAGNRRMMYEFIGEEEV